MKTSYIVGGALVLGVGAYFMFGRRPGAMQTAFQQASTGVKSSQPSTQYPFVVPNAPRADNNPYLNNQPYSQYMPSGGGSVLGTAQTISAVAGAADSISQLFSNLFSSSTGANSPSTMSAMDVTSFNASAGSSNLGGGMDASYYDTSLNSSQNFGMVV